MTVASAEVAIKGVLDRMAKQREGIRAAVVGGTDYWDRVDAGADETFENRVEGRMLTALDLAQVGGSAMGASFISLWNLLNTYALSDLGIDVTSSPLSAYLDAYSGKRVAYDAAELLVESLGSPSRLLPQYVFPKGTRPANLATPSGSDMLLIGTLLGTAGNPTYTPGTALDDSVIGGTVLMLVNAAGTTTVTDLILTCTRLDNTTVPITVTVSAATAFAQSLVGGAQVGVGGAAAGQADVLIKTSAAQFKVGEWVLIIKATGVEEFKQVKEINTLTLTLGNMDAETPLMNALLEDDKVYPVFTDVTWTSGTVADGKTIYIYAYPDRIIAL